MQIGVFDSGIGGLTVFDALDRALPEHGLLYLGDTARVPYGTRSPLTVVRYARRVASYLVGQGVDAMVIACNTATAHALATLREEFDLPILGVIGPGVEATLADPDTERVGIIATRGTIRSHAYQHALAQQKTGLIIHAQSAPLLVPLIEEDWLEHPAAEAALHTYLSPMVDKGIDALLLACTHYPLLMPVLRRFLPEEIRLVDSASTCANHLREELSRLDLLNDSKDPGTLQIYLTDLSEQFEMLARRFLNHPPGKIRRATL